LFNVISVIHKVCPHQMISIDGKGGLILLFT
jgi:hypothetical protein